jgi:thiamine transport system ATP-binding protein
LPSEGLRVEALSAARGGARILDGVSLAIDGGATLALLGPNGAGKSTLLRCVAGLEPTSSGTVELAGRDVSRVPAHLREIGFVPQEPSLFPHRTVAENIAFGPAIRRFPRSRVDAEIRAQADRLGVAGLLQRYPSQLSGGEMQRVALARALAARPRALLLDEPFANLDPEFRTELRAEFRSIFQGMEIPILHVTHDREEALFLADHLVLLFSGRVRQSGSPSDIVERPQDAQVARFLGFNVLRTDAGELAVRPDDLLLSGPEDGIRATVVSSGFVGRAESVHLTLADGSRAEVRRGLHGTPVRPGQKVGLRWANAVRIESAVEGGLPPETLSPGGGRVK